MPLPSFLEERMRGLLRRNGALVYDNRMQAVRFRKLVPEPDLVVDVGVADRTPWLYDSFSEKPFLLVDPMAECEEEVAAAYPNLNFEFRPVALGDHMGKAKLNVPFVGQGKRGRWASMLTRSRSDHLTARVTNWETRTVDVTTLDALTEAKTGRIGLKIDTEGSEAAILRGAEKTLSQCDFVVLELSLRMRFEEVDVPSTSIAMLRDAGLELRDVLSVNGGKMDQSPIHIDCLFTRWV